MKTTNYLREKPGSRLKVHAASRLTIMARTFLLGLLISFMAFPQFVHAAPAISENNIRLDLPGKNNFKIVVVNDSHIAEESDEIRKEKRDYVRARVEHFRLVSGSRSTDTWNRILEKLDGYHADLIVFAGDMVDYYSRKNYSILRNGLKKLKTPYIYLRANHDRKKGYTGKSRRNVKKQGKKLGDDNPVIVRNYRRFVVVGINDSTSNLTREGYLVLRDVWNMNKPVILFTHVPFESHIDSRLTEKSKTAWKGRVYLWSDRDTYYRKTKYTKKFLKMLYAKKSPVKAVIAGHLHFSDTSKLTKNTTQYVLDASYRGNVGIVRIS